MIKGIDCTVDPREIKEDLEKQGFRIKWVHNILNKFRVPQPMFKVELENDSTSPKKGEIHPIYKINNVLHRKVTIDEPYKRKGPVQCMNCLEFGHTRSYCKLKTICVICGGNHESSICSNKREDTLSKKTAVEITPQTTEAIQSI